MMSIKPISARKCVVFAAVLNVLMLVSAGMYGPAYGRSFYDKMIFHPRSEYRNNPDLVDGVQKRDLSFTTAKGDVVHGWYFDVPDSNKIALVSEGNGGNMGYLVPLAQLLMQCKCSVLLYDYEGYGTTEGRPTLNRVVNDGLAAFDYMDKKLAAGKKKIVVGVSLGTGVTCQISKRRTADAIILSSPFTSLLNMARQKMSVFRYTPAVVLPRQHLDNVAVLRRAHAPLLILHGTEDTLIPLAESEKLFAEACAPKTFVKLEKAGHNDTFKLTKEEYLKALHAFLDGIN